MKTFRLLALSAALGTRPLFTESVAAADRARDVATLCQAFIESKLQIWQARLNLTGWEVKVLLARVSEIKPRTLGNIHWDQAQKSAVIRVLSPQDYNLPLPEMLKDMENTVVHELVHLELAAATAQADRSEASRQEEEHAVNQITGALLELQAR